VRPPLRQPGSCQPWYLPGRGMKHHTLDVSAYTSGWQPSQTCGLEDIQGKAGHQPDPDVPLRSHQARWGIDPSVGDQPGPRGGAEPGDHMLRDEARTLTRGGSAVGPHQAAGAARKHRQCRAFEGGEETSYALSH
jgi:hypothetical protein